MGRPFGTGLVERYAKKLVKGPAPHPPAASVWRIEEGEARVEERTLIPFGPALKDIAEELLCFFQTRPQWRAVWGGGPRRKACSCCCSLKGEERSGSRREVEEDGGYDSKDVHAVRRNSTSDEPRREAGESAAVPGFVEPAPKRKSALRKPEKEEGSQLDGLDPTVVAAAVEAGVPVEQLKHLGSLLKKTTRMQDVATSQKARPVRRNLLSESEDEDEDAAEEEEWRRRSQKEKEAPGCPSSCKADSDHGGVHEEEALGQGLGELAGCEQKDQANHQARAPPPNPKQLHTRNFGRL